MTDSPKLAQAPVLEQDTDIIYEIAENDKDRDPEKPVDETEKHEGPIVATIPVHGGTGRLQVQVGEAAPEVRAIIPEIDDPEEVTETFRAYFLGTIVCIVGTGLNVWFGARQPGIYLSPLLAQFVVQPMGMFLAKVLPRHKFTLFGYTMSFNPGPWTVKEHTIVSIMATVSLPTATALDIIITTRSPVYFNDPIQGGNLGYQFLIVLSTQFLGFGLAGVSREFLVYPSQMTWPSNLAKAALFNALHRRRVDEAGNATTEEAHGLNGGQKDPPVHGWTISMFRFCLYAAGGSFCWLFISNYILPFLTNFNWPTWIAPHNKKLAIVMGSVTGYGVNPFPTLDWTFINAAGNTPLVTPWWATFSSFIGTVIGLFVCLGIYFSNTWYSAHLLPNSNTPFDRFGKAYNTTRVLTPEKTLDPVKYANYSPLYYTAGKNVVLGAYFATYGSTLIHAALNHWDQIKMGTNIAWRQVRISLGRKPTNEEETNRPDLDIHYVFAKQYPEAPQWWFIVIAAVALVMGIVCCEVYKTQMPVWGIFVALFLCVLFLIPAGIILAVSNVHVSVVVLAQMIPGVALPGKPYANMIFKTFGWVSLTQALLYVQDQKLAHYMHVAPRATFRAQMWACLVGSLISLAVLNWQMEVIPDLCTVGQKDRMTCPYYTTFYSGALLYGVIGPTRMFGSQGLYKNLLWAFLVGAGLTVVAWLIKKKWPNKYTNQVNLPVIISGAAWFAPYNFAYVWSGVPLAWFFMSYLYNRFPAWWRKYCYILSIGLTIGAAVSGIIQFFCLTYVGATMPKWWGNTFPTSGCDGKGCPLLPMPSKGYIGPGPGQYH